MQKIGILWAGDMSDVWRFRDAFRQKLSDLGKVEGRDIVIDDCYVKGNPKPLSELAADLAAAVDVIVASGTPAAQAARDATQTKPIVFAAVGDPNLVKAKNVTGVLLAEPGLSGDRLKVLKEALPSIKRVAALWNSDNPVHTIYLKAMPDAEPVGVQGPQDLDRALSVLSKNLPEALIVCPDPAFASQRTKIMSFALERKLPAIYSFSRYVEEGGLMSYGPNYTDMFRQAAALVNSILKQPSQLPPMEQVRGPELVVNLNTARRIGATIPDSVLARATVIN